MKKVYEVTSPFNENVDWETKDVWGIPVLWNKLPDKIIDNTADVKIAPVASLKADSRITL